MSEHRRGRPGRRPYPVPRERKFWYPTVEESVYDEIFRQAGVAGVGVSTYVQALLADAHAVFGPFTEPVPRPLPTVVPVDEFLRRVDAITALECIPTRADARRCPLKLDKPISDAVEAHAAALGVNGSGYIRAVMHVAVGTNARALYQAEHREGERRVPELAGAR